MYLDFNENNVKCIDNCLIYLDELLSREEVVLSEDDFNSYLDKYRYASCHIFTYGNNWNQLDVRSKSRIFNYSINFENGMFSEIEFVKVYYRQCCILVGKFISIFNLKPLFLSNV